ncbi:carboxymuconolactone decarboxylase [Betaproteobacteria bacterium GR16-43]|nr:carboxymuconolactone decarboxylase [Betaproteobacteria bacterium GR16-43]
MKTLAAAAATFALMQPVFAEQVEISRAGTRASSPGPRENFTGTVRVDPVFPAKEPGRTSGGNVTFSPGARSNWHTHPIAQVLVVTAGVGRVQQWGSEMQEIRPGDVVRIPAGVKHWHGAAPDSSMTHLAITEQLDGKAVEWMEPVTDAQYGANVPTRGGVAGAQGLFGDVAPKLADLTDTVLFGDVWARPGLSQRDRSLVTVSALIALNRPEQLRSHMARALQNGVTEEELVETLTQLAFYSGWPNAINAANVAREVFKQKP